MSKIIIAGSRDLNPSIEMIDGWMRALREWLGMEPTEIVSGGCRGVDLAGEAWAKANGIPIKRFDADWDTHRKAAGPIRNRQMAEYADCLIAFYRDDSKGTKNMIKEAEKHDLELMLFRLDPSDDEEIEAIDK